MSIDTVRVWFIDDLSPLNSDLLDRRRADGTAVPLERVLEGRGFEIYEAEFNISSQNEIVVELQLGHADSFIGILPPLKKRIR